MTVKAVSHT